MSEVSPGIKRLFSDTGLHLNAIRFLAVPMPQRKRVGRASVAWTGRYVGWMQTSRGVGSSLPNRWAVLDREHMPPILMRIVRQFRDRWYHCAVVP